MTNKVGRPTKLDDKMSQEIIDLLKKGTSVLELIEIVGISKQTFYNWLNSNKDFLDSVKKARNIADDIVVASLFQRATGYYHPEIKVFCDKGHVTTFECDKHYPPDTAAAIFWLKNRQPKEWKDKQEIEQSGMVTVTPATRDQLLTWAIEARKEKESKKLPEGEDEE